MSLTLSKANRVKEGEFVSASVKSECSLFRFLIESFYKPYSLKESKTLTNV